MKNCANTTITLQTKPLDCIDFRFIYKVDTRQNFIIKCEDQEEFDKICQILNSKSKLISFEKFMQAWEKRC